MATTEISTLSLHDALPILPELLTDIALPWELLDALVPSERASRMGNVLALVIAYERGSWHEVGRYCDALARSEEHTSELQSRLHLVCRLLLEKKNRS